MDEVDATLAERVDEPMTGWMSEREEGSNK